MNHRQLANKLRESMLNGSFDGHELAYHLARDPDVAVPFMEFIDATLTMWADLHARGLHNSPKDAAVFKKAASMLNTSIPEKPKTKKVIQPPAASQIWE